MSNKRGPGDYFRKRLKIERENRDWSQADMSKLLLERKIGISVTALSKLEAGTRDVKIDEATAIADLFDLSLDSMLGRHGLEDEKDHAMSVLADEATRLLPKIVEIAERLRDAYGELERQFDFKNFDQYVAQGATWSLLGLDIEHQRALLMWTGRDLAMHAVNQLAAGLYAAAMVRSMTATQLAEHLDVVRGNLTALDEHHAATAAMGIKQ